MKRFMLSLAAAFLTAAVNADLIDMVPAGSKFVMSANVKGIMSLKDVQEMMSDDKSGADFKKFKADLAKHDLTVNDLIGEMVLFGKGDQTAPEYGVIATTKVKEATLKTFLDGEAVDDGGKLSEQYHIENIGGHKVFVFDTSAQNALNMPGMMQMPGQDLNAAPALTYLKSDVVLLSDKTTFPALLKGIESGKSVAGSEMLAGADKKALVWGAFEMDRSAASAQPRQGLGNPLDKIEGGGFSLDMTGKNKSDLDLNLALDCVSAQDAAMLRMQAQGLMMMASGSMSDNPELALRLTQALRFGNNGDTLSLKATFPEKLLDELRAYGEAKSAAAPSVMFEEEEEILVPGVPPKRERVKPAVGVPGMPNK